MKRKNKDVKKQNLKIAFVFFSFIAFLIVLSFLFKLAMVLKKSSFDDSHRFTISVSSSFKNENSKILSFSKKPNSISILTVSNKLDLKNDKILQRYLEIPIDGYIEFNEEIGIKNSNAEKIIKKSVLDSGKIKTNLTTIDLIKLWLFTRLTSNNLQIEQSINDILDEYQIDKLSSALFLDNEVSQENQSIQIINASEISGLANRLSRFVTNLGGNVVSVKTNSEVSKSSGIIFFGKKTYTVNKLGKTLGFKVINGEKEQRSGAISDIIIVIGTDKLHSLPF